jgi:uncharacterized protein
MKINAASITPEGLSLKENIDARQLELETEVVRFKGPLRLSADVSRITNTVTAILTLEGAIEFTCVRCLEEFGAPLNKTLRFVFEVDNREPVIDLGPQIREEIIVDYPLKPLCRDNCQGLCPQCGKNLNEGGCSCATTKKKTL